MNTLPHTSDEAADSPPENWKQIFTLVAVGATLAIFLALALALALSFLITKAST